MTWKILARHKFLGGTISESENGEYTDGIAVRRYTATIRGWRNWKLYEGKTSDEIFQQVIEKAKKIRDRIDSGDESVFEE